MEGGFAVSPTDVWGVGSMKGTGGANYDAQPVALHFDGSTWTSVPVPLPVNATGAYLVSVSGTATDDLWAVGSTDGAVPAAFVIHWDGVAWSVEGTPDPLGFVEAFYDVEAITTNDVWAVGESGDPALGRRLIQHWDGATWSAVPAPPNGSGGGAVNAISAASGDDVWALAEAPNTEDEVLHWNGTVWKKGQIPVPNDVFWNHSVTAVNHDDVWFGGFDFQGSTEVARIKRWDGSSWTEVAVNESAWAVYNVAASSPRDVWVAGADSDQTKVYGYHWDGQQLSAFPQPNPPNHTVYLGEGAVTALPSGDLWAVGTQRTTSRGRAEPYILRLCPVVVSDVLTTRRAPASTVSRTTMSNAVAWKFHRKNRQAHQIKDSSGMRLFDSGRRGKGGSYTRVYSYAGTYTWKDPLGVQRGEVQVPPSLRPVSGGRGTIRWATKPVRDGFAVDVQVKKPGDAKFTWWKRGVASQKAEFSPSKKGTYKIRVRLKKTGTGKHSGWSPAITFQRT